MSQSGWPAAHMFVRNFSLNIRNMGDSTEYNVSSSKESLAHDVVLFSHLSLTIVRLRLGPFAKENE